MSAFISYGGARVHTGSLTIASSGAWVADVSFAGDLSLPTTAALEVGNLALLGSIYRARAFSGQVRARLVGGYGGWHKQLGARAYSLPGGVKLSMVLGDAAHDAGEKIVVANDYVIGDYFVRQAGEGTRTLRGLLGEQWYVDTDGTTRTGQRTGSAVSSDFLVNAFDTATGTATVSTERYTEWMPGNTFQNAVVPEPQTIATVRIDADNTGKLRHTVLVKGAETDHERLTGALRQLIREEIAAAGLFGLYSYSVLDATADSVTCTPLDATAGLPAVVSVPLRNGVAGLSAKPAPGADVVLAFVDGNPARPRVMGGHSPPSIARTVICYGDTVNVPGVGDVALTPGTTEAVELAALELAGSVVRAQRLTP